jgi:hypothetical protein
VIGFLVVLLPNEKLRKLLQSKGNEIELVKRTSLVPDENSLRQEADNL